MNPSNVPLSQLNSRRAYLQNANAQAKIAPTPQTSRSVQSKRFILMTLSLGVTCAASAWLATSVGAAPSSSDARRAKGQKTVTKTQTTKNKSATAKKLKPMPRYLPMQQINWLRESRQNLINWGALQPLMNGRVLPRSAQSLPGATAYIPNFKVPLPRIKNKKAKVQSVAQQIPRPVAPARVRPATPITPRWVRYPLEFQLAGIGIGTRAVDKDRFNRIDRYGLFAMHGNPTAVVVPGQVAAATAGGGEGASGSGSGSSEGSSAGAAPQTQNLTLQQQPPEIATLFPGSTNDGLPDWAAAITVQLDNNHVEWLYNRDTYAMGFVVDRLGFVDAIVCAGTASPIARTQLEDPVHTIKLGDDLRKVLFRYGYPDTIETYTVSVAGVGTGAPAGAAGGEGASAAPGGDARGGSGAEGGGTAAAQAGNNAYRTFELRYEQSYNVVFTIRNNRVVRIYIFGDPDFFNDRRRRQFRIAY